MKVNVLFILLGLFVAQFSVAQEAPAVSKSEFSEQALAQVLLLFLKANTLY